jgi:hypothetical protein
MCIFIFGLRKGMFDLIWIEGDWRGFNPLLFKFDLLVGCAFGVQ